MTAWLAILYGAGIVLILAEFIVPGMICGILGGGMVIASAVLACINFPQYAVMILVGELVGVFISVVIGMYLLSKTRAGKRFILDSSQQAGAGWVASESDESLLGASAEVFTALRPAGTVLINNKRIDAVSDGSFIDKGVRVRVIEVHGSRVVVEPARDK